MSSAVCQKYQDVILHLVAFLQCASQHASLALLTHSLLHNRRYTTWTERAREHRQMKAHLSCILERIPFISIWDFPLWTVTDVWAQTSTVLWWRIFSQSWAYCVHFVGQLQCVLSLYSIYWFLHQLRWISLLTFVNESVVIIEVWKHF